MVRAAQLWLLAEPWMKNQPVWVMRIYLVLLLKKIGFVPDGPQQFLVCRFRIVRCVHKGQRSAGRGYIESIDFILRALVNAWLMAPTAFPPANVSELVSSSAHPDQEITSAGDDKIFCMCLAT